MAKHVLNRDFVTQLTQLAEQMERGELPSVGAEKPSGQIQHVRIIANESGLSLNLRLHTPKFEIDWVGNGFSITFWDHDATTICVVVRKREISQPKPGVFFFHEGNVRRLSLDFR